MNIFKVCYHWHEGEYDEILLAKETTQEAFEKDLKDAKDKTQYKTYIVACTPEFYEDIIGYLINIGYKECTLLGTIDYEIDEDKHRAVVTKKETKVTLTAL